MKVAEQIKTEDPQAYDYLQGNEGMDRIGAGFIAILSSLFFAMFDITASILVLIGFLIFRWAVDRGAGPRHGRPAAPGHRAVCDGWPTPSSRPSSTSSSSAPARPSTSTRSTSS